MGKKLRIFNIIALCLAFCLLFLVSFSSVVYLIEKKSMIYSYFSFSKASDIYWAKKIMNGGYILHFRHAERDKWTDVQMYDALESDVHNNGLNESRYAENDYFDKAVCLNAKGKIQAKAIGESLKYIGLPIGAVHSSVSCRARQTAELAFGGYDQLHRILVHRGPYNEDPKIHIEKLKTLYSNFAEINAKNIIVSSHGRVIDCEMFVNYKCPVLGLKEGGFYVIRNTKDGLVFEHEFSSFGRFNRVFYKR